MGSLEIFARSASTGYGTLTTTIDRSIIHATINNPPINLWDYKLSDDFSSFIDSLAANSTGVKVVTIASANQDFWISHYDIHALSNTDPIKPPGDPVLLGEQLLRTRTNLATLPVIFIAEINGRTSGAGNEVAVQCDIRYAGPATRLSQLEIAFGLLPGAGGVQFLVKLIGRARALEYILSARPIDAATAAAIGWVNCAFDSAQELSLAVDALAQRIATWPEQGLRAVKESVNRQKPSDADLDGDNAVFLQLAKTSVTQAAADKFLALGDEIRGSFELNVPDDLAEIVPPGQ